MTKTQNTATKIVAKPKRKKKAKKTVAIPTGARKINVAAFRRELAALNRGFRKYPAALKGVKNAFSHREVLSLIKKFDISEKKIEEHENGIKKEHAVSQNLAVQNKTKFKKTKKLVRVYLPKEKREDFVVKRKKRKERKKKN